MASVTRVRYNCLATATVTTRMLPDITASSNIKMENTMSSGDRDAHNAIDFQTPPAHSRRIGLGRDPVSHKIIEKRRRDRMNQCLNQLSSLLPSTYKKQRGGRVEKTEILELAIHYIKYLISTASDRSFNANTPQASFAEGYGRCAAHLINVMCGLKDIDPSCASDFFIAQLRCHLENICAELEQGKRTEQAVSPDQDTQDDNITSELASTCWSRETTQSRVTSSSSSSESRSETRESDSAGFKFKDLMRKRFSSAPAEVSGASTPVSHESMGDEPETNIPCFVLFADRDSYSPLSVPSSLLKRYATSANGSSNTSHPVSIMVDFGEATARRGTEAPRPES